MAQPRKTFEQIPAKLTIVVYILICLEVGVLLMILPWTPYWDDNFFLYFVTGKLRAAWLGDLIHSGYTRGAVTALGLINIGAGLWEGFRFRENVRAFSAWEAPSNEPARTHSSAEAATESPANLPDHRSPSLPPSPGSSGDGN